MVDRQRYEAVLRDRLNELRTRLTDVESELEKPSDPDPEERATEREEDEILEGLGSAGQNEIRMIEAALSRIAQGTFGVCAACGEPISEQRLSAVPYAARCRNCA